jgi:hypothetical protein
MAVTGVSVTMANLIRGDKKVLVDAVSGEKDGGSSQTREESLKAVPSRKGTCESPCLAVRLLERVTPILCKRLY